MAALPEFKSQLASVHQLFFKATSPSCRIIGSSMVAGSSSDKWKISLVSIPETGNMSYFERTLVYADLLAITKTLGEFSWPVFFKHIKTVLRAGDLIFDTPSKDAIHLYFSKQDSGLSSPIDISVPKASDEDQSRITSFLFTSVERIQLLETRLATAEAAAASSHHKLVEAISPKKATSYESGVKSIAIIGAKVTASTPTEPKKTGGSLLNPGRKKYANPFHFRSNRRQF